MTRTTRAHLDSIIEDINKLQPHGNGRYGVDVNVGGYRLVFDKSSGGAVDCSERVGLSVLYGVCYGIRCVLQRGRA